MYFSPWVRESRIGPTYGQNGVRVNISNKADKTTLDVYVLFVYFTLVWNLIQLMICICFTVLVFPSQFVVLSYLYNLVIYYEIIFILSSVELI